MTKYFEKLLKDIIKYDEIYLFHHIYPDIDSLGAKYGLYYWIRKNFPLKNVYCINSDAKTLPNKFCNLFKAMTNPELENKNKILGIISDTNSLKRADYNDFELLNKIIIIDHHPLPEKNINSNILSLSYMLHDTHASSTCEIVATFLFHCQKNYLIPIESINALFLGIVTDTGRFLHDNTNINTYKIVREFKKLGLNEKSLYEELYEESVDKIKLKGYIVNNLEIINKHIAYYFLSEKIMNKFNVEYKEGKELVYAMSGIKGVKIWVLATFNPDFKEYALSIRSRRIIINKVAAKYNGGGHPFASGCKIKNKNDIPNLLKDLENLIT